MNDKISACTSSHGVENTNEAVSIAPTLDVFSRPAALPRQLASLRVAG